MNELMLFEGNEVEVIEYDGVILFNPYHIGKCLGISDSTIRDRLGTMNEKQVIRLRNSDVEKPTSEN